MTKRHQEKDEIKHLPIAKRLNQSADTRNLKIKKINDSSNELDLETKIAQLEAELNNESESSTEGSSSSECESESESEDKKKKKKKSKVDSDDVFKDNEVLSFSKCNDDRIPSLPQHLLPHNHKKSLEKSKKISKTKKDISISQEPMDLKGVPFSCKTCVYVAKNLEEFQQHMGSATHKKTFETLQEKMYCKLCDKQFTSLDQLEEHKKGKWHKKRVEMRVKKHTPRLCYDFLRGSCKRGDKCMFTHQKATKKNKVCFDYQNKGSCRMGEQCIFLHENE